MGGPQEPRITLPISTSSPVSLPIWDRLDTSIFYLNVSFRDSFTKLDFPQ